MKGNPKKNILLVEPRYKNKYPPLGLMKLASYHGPRGRNDYVEFIKGEDPTVFNRTWDRIYVTTLFSFEWVRTAEAIDFAIAVAGNQPERVFVGGIAASLMHDEFLNEPRWAGVRFIKGLLDGPPAIALKLSMENFDFGVQDIHGTPIEELPPDYSILQHTDYVYPVRDAYFGYASRGCVRKCKFCGVPKLEGAQKEMPPLAKLVNAIDENDGPKKDLILMDNNITASARFREVIAEIRDLGFYPGAKFSRDGKRQQKRRVDFNQGVDARILAKSPMYLQELSTVCISPLRIAFDHLGLRKVYNTSVRMAADNGITSLSNYMLYNFMDTPVDLYERMRFNIYLNQELGIRIWSFPMRYQPVTLKDRSHVGKNWNRYFLRSFQIMLQATHGIVSGNPGFFMRAYGESQKEFEHLLGLPHAFIFNRDYYERGAGEPVRHEYEILRRQLSSQQIEELIALLSGAGSQRRPSINQLQRMSYDLSIDSSIRRILHFYTIPLSEKIESNNKQKVLPLFAGLNEDPVLPEDQIVEDAGLYESDSSVENTKLAT